MPIISIIIVTYNSDSYISECLESIFYYNDLEESDIEVIIVDNSLVTSNYLRTKVNTFPNSKLISNPQNGGFGQGNNIGASIAQGKILLFLNPDTKFVEPLFKEVIRKFRNYPQIGVVGCKLIDEMGKPCFTYGYFPEKRNIIRDLIDKFLFQKIGYIPKKNIYPWGADLFIRRSDFINAGGFDENIFLCHEEPDICTRLKPNKTAIISKKIIHFEGHSTKISEIKYDSWGESLIYYLKKYRYNISRTLRNLSFVFYMYILIGKLIRKDIGILKLYYAKIKELKIKYD